MKPNPKLKTVQYHGGKSGRNPAARWIASILPWDFNTTYIEPFAGMLGILTQRQPVINEIVNDINGDIINWWIQVRDNYDELARLVALTPHSRDIFKQAKKDLENADTSPVKRALALYIIVRQSLMHVPTPKVATWGITYTPHRMSPWIDNELVLLAERIRHVYFENRDALEVLERVSMEKNAVVYCDPPYHSAATACYGKGKDGTDWKRMEELLQAQKGRCAVSGYGDEWDCLGWHRHSFTKGYTVLKEKGYRESQERTEVLWCNFKVEKSQRTMEL